MYILLFLLTKNVMTKLFPGFCLPYKANIIQIGEHKRKNNFVDMLNGSLDTMPFPWGKILFSNKIMCVL